MLGWQREFIDRILEIKIVDKPGIYLYRTRFRLHKEEGGAVRTCLAKRRVHSLNFSGRLAVLAKHTLSTIPIYLFLVFRAPVYFVQEVRKIIVRFFFNGD